MKKYKLRDQFTLKLGRDTLIGPCVVEVDEQTYKLHSHKLEEITANTPVETTDQKKQKAKNA